MLREANPFRSGDGRCRPQPRCISSTAEPPHQEDCLQSHGPVNSRSIRSSPLGDRCPCPRPAGLTGTSHRPHHLVFESYDELNGRSQAGAAREERQKCGGSCWHRSDCCPSFSFWTMAPSAAACAAPRFATDADIAMSAWSGAWSVGDSTSPRPPVVARSLKDAPFCHPRLPARSPALKQTAGS